MKELHFYLLDHRVICSPLWLLLLRSLCDLGLVLIGTMIHLGLSSPFHTASKMLEAISGVSCLQASIRMCCRWARPRTSEPRTALCQWHGFGWQCAHSDLLDFAWSPNDWVDWTLLVISYVFVACHDQKTLMGAMVLFWCKRCIWESHKSQVFLLNALIFDGDIGVCFCFMQCSICFL